jgi:hypothetical protein
VREEIQRTVFLCQGRNVSAGFLPFFPTLARVGYVTDKCVVCPGVAMLVNYASQYAGLGAEIQSQLFTASNWNLRFLGLNVGTGGAVTLLASIKSEWDNLPLSDSVRLNSKEWLPHLRDILLSTIVQARQKYCVRMCYSRFVWLTAFLVAPTYITRACTRQLISREYMTKRMGRSISRRSMETT